MKIKGWEKGPGSGTFYRKGGTRHEGGKYPLLHVAKTVGINPSYCVIFMTLDRRDKLFPTRSKTLLTTKSRDKAQLFAEQYMKDYKK